MAERKRPLSATSGGESEESRLSEREEGRTSDMRLRGGGEMVSVPEAAREEICEAMMEAFFASMSNNSVNAEMPVAAIISSVSSSPGHRWRILRHVLKLIAPATKEETSEAEESWLSGMEESNQTYDMRLQGERVVVSEEARAEICKAMIEAFVASLSNNNVNVEMPVVAVSSGELSSPRHRWQRLRLLLREIVPATEQEIIEVEAEQDLTSREA